MFSNTNARLVLHETVRFPSLTLGIVGAWNFESDVKACMMENKMRQLWPISWLENACLFAMIEPTSLLNEGSPVSMSNGLYVMENVLLQLERMTDTTNNCKQAKNFTILDPFETTN